MFLLLEYSYHIYERRLYFKVICLTSDFKILQKKELYYVWKSDNLAEKGLEMVLYSSEERALFTKLLTQFTPKAIYQ